MYSSLGYIKKITDFPILSILTNYRNKKVVLQKNDEETNNQLEKAQIISSISHQSSPSPSSSLSTSSSRGSADHRNYEHSCESSLNSILESVPTKAELDDSMKLLQSKAEIGQMYWASGYIKKITDFPILSRLTNYRKKIVLQKNDEVKTNILIEKAQIMSSISHQSSSSSADHRNDEIIVDESENSSESSPITIFESVPTKAEADDSMKLLQRNKKVVLQKNDEETNNQLEKTTDIVALKLEPSTLIMSSISHQPSSSSISSSSPSLSSSSSRSSLISIFGSVHSSMKVFQSFIYDEGSRMVAANPGLQIVKTCFEFVTRTMVQAVIRSLVVCDESVLLADVSKKPEVKACLKGNSAAKSSKSKPKKSSSCDEGLISVILNWLLENMESEMLGIFDIMRSLVVATIQSSLPANNDHENSSSSSDAAAEQAIHMVPLLTIYILIVFVKRALAYFKKSLHKYLISFF